MIEIFTANPWQMTLGERSALEAVLTGLKPRLAIEIGTAEGGSLTRIAAHSETVHSFDLVEHSLPTELFDNVTFHTGDSHALLPAKLAELADRGENVDFVLVDGDHSAEGVRADLEDLLASDAIKRTVILVHDTLNDVVRDGISQVDLDGNEKVVHVELDMVVGHLSRDGAYRNQLWGGVGVIIVESGGTKWPEHDFHDPFTVFSTVRGSLASADGDTTSIPESPDPEDTELLRRELAAKESRLRTIEESHSWRLTAPLRRAMQQVRARRP